MVSDIRQVPMTTKHSTLKGTRASADVRIHQRVPATQFSTPKGKSNFPRKFSN